MDLNIFLKMINSDIILLDCFLQIILLVKIHKFQKGKDD